MPARDKQPQRGYQKLTPDRATQIAAMIEQGVSFDAAAMAVGCNPKTAQEWLYRGRGTHSRPVTPLYEFFARKVDEAFGKREQGAVEEIVHVMRFAERDADRLNAAKFLLTHGAHRDNWRPAKQEVVAEVDTEIVLRMPTPLELADLHGDVIEVEESGVVELSLPETTEDEPAQNHGD